MLTKIPSILGRFVFLIVLQVIVLNNVSFGGYINPYLYVLFILWLPFDTPNWLVLIFGFAIGFFIDVFSSTLGMHISATLFLAFMRHHTLRIISPRGGYDINLEPNATSMGVTWFLTYSSILVFLHHCWLFFIEIFRFSEFFTTIWRALLSTIFTLILILLSQLLVYRKSSSK